MHCFSSRLKDNDRGQSLVEFAIILPLMLLLLLGIIQFGLIFNGQITLTGAAREGARLALVCPNDLLVKERIEEAAVALLLNIKPEDIEIDRTVGGKLSVKVNGTVEVIVPLMDLVAGEAFAVSAEAVMRTEGN